MRSHNIKKEVFVELFLGGKSKNNETDVQSKSIFGNVLL